MQSSRTKTPEQVALMAEAGKRLAAMLEALRAEVREGATGNDLDRFAEEFIRKAGDKPAFLGYRPGGAKHAYPATLCVSLNDTVVHGVPNDEPFKVGDVVKVDAGLVHEGWYSDSAITVAVGPASETVKKLIRVTEEALMRGIKAAKPNGTLGDIGAAIQSHVEAHGFSIVKSLTGHGIGRKLHEEPWVYNIGTPGHGEPLVAGMVIAIEPMVAIGKGDVKQGKDDSFVTKDHSLAAHFEHTIAITEKGPIVLTQL